MDVNRLSPADFKAGPLRTVLFWIVVVLIIIALGLAWHNLYKATKTRHTTAHQTTSQGSKQTQSPVSPAKGTSQTPPNGAAAPSTSGTGPGSSNSLLGPNGQ